MDANPSHQLWFHMLSQKLTSLPFMDVHLSHHLWFQMVSPLLTVVPFLTAAPWQRLWFLMVSQLLAVLPFMDAHPSTWLWFQKVSHLLDNLPFPDAPASQVHVAGESQHILAWVFANFESSCTKHKECDGQLVLIQELFLLHAWFWTMKCVMKWRDASYDAV